MATISSTMKIQDAFSQNMERMINLSSQIVDSMEMVNRSAKLPNMDAGFASMRTEIGIASHELEQMNSNLNQMEQQDAGISRATSGFHGLSKAIVVVNQGLQLMQTAWSGIENIGSKADERINVDARLNLINDGSQSQSALEAQVMAAANNTRSDYASTAALVAQMGRQDYFKGNNQSAIQFAETLNKGFVVSGASATEAAGAITQLTQGLASGVLRGDEFNSIMENAPVLSEMMTQSMGITKGQLRSMAEDGKLTTDVVVSSIMAQAGALDSQFAQMPVTFSQAKTVMGNNVSQMMDYLSQPGQAVNVIITKVQELTAYLNTPDGQALMLGIAAGISFAADCIDWFLTLCMDTYQYIADNWSWIEPVFLGIASAIGLAAAANLIYKGVMAASTGIQIIATALTAAHAGITMAKANADVAATAAQWGLNTAILACPVTWIILAVIALIVIIYAVVGAINQLAGTSYSATGIICGAFATAGAVIGNILIAAYNLGVDTIANIWNYIASFAEFFANVFNDPIGSIVRLFANMADVVLGILQNIASAIDTIFGQNFASTIGGWRDGLQGQVDSLVGEAQIKVDRMDSSAMHLERLNYGDAYNSGYSVGQSIDQKLDIGSLLKGVELPDSLQNQDTSIPDYGSAYENANSRGANPTGGKLDSVGKIDQDVDISNQSLEYLNDIAEMQALDAFDAYQTVVYDQMNDLKLSPADADALRNSANSDTNIYYLNYSGGVNIKNDIKKGEDWESIRKAMEEESENDIQSGLGRIEEELYA